MCVGHPTSNRVFAARNRRKPKIGSPPFGGGASKRVQRPGETTRVFLVRFASRNARRPARARARRADGQLICRTRVCVRLIYPLGRTEGDRTQANACIAKSTSQTMMMPWLQPDEWHCEACVYVGENVSKHSFYSHSTPLSLLPQAATVSTPAPAPSA